MYLTSAETQNFSTNLFFSSLELNQRFGASNNTGLIWYNSTNLKV